jgi:hypothetical protein
MDFNSFEIKTSHIRELLPNIELCNYEVFNDVEQSWNITKQKYGNYLWPLSDIEHHVLYLHLIKNACDNKKMIIRNPMYVEYNQDDIISSDIYFITTQKNIRDYIICNYYFEKEKIVLGVYLGTGMDGLNVSIAYIIYFDHKYILSFYGGHIINNTLLSNIYNIIQNIDIEKINNEPPLVRTIEGYNQGLFHTCCTFVNGLYIMDKIGIKNNIDELIMGPNDPFLIEKYYKNKYPEINVNKEKIDVNDFENNTVYRGILFKYTHFHVTNKCREFMKSYINEVMPISNDYKNEIEYIKNNFYPIFSINLRCQTCEIKDQSIVISEVINKLKNVYPDSFFLIGGFIGDYNEEYINKNNISIAPLTGSYNSLLNEYENVFESIKKNLQHTHIKSLINLKINNILKFVENVHFSINMNSGYTCIETILNDIPTTYFGTRWNEHNKKLFYISKETYKEPIFVDEPDIIFLTQDNGNNNSGIYDNTIISEISSDTIVNIVTNYDRKNNFVLNKNTINKI